MTDSRPRPPGTLRLIVGGLLLVAIATALIISGPTSLETVSSWGGNIDLEAPSEIDAGSPLVVTVTADARDETLVQLAVFAPLNTTLLEAPLFDGRAEFPVSQRLTEHAGSLHLVARIDSQSSNATVVQVSPLAAVDPVVPLVGPRTIIADGSDFTMTVVTPIDQFGNPLAPGTPVTIDVLRPDGERTLLEEQTTGGLAAALIDSTTEAGRVTISSRVHDADGPSNTVDQVAGRPADFTVQVDERNAIADGFALHEVQTSELRDRFDNLLPDGVGATFIVETTAGTSLVYAVVQGSVARAVVEAPDQSGEITIRARVSGHESPPVSMTFDPAVETFPAFITSSLDGATITVGPVLTTRGGYAPDGTLVTITASATGETIAQTALRGGTAELDFEQPLEQEGPLDATLLGATTSVLRPEVTE